MKILLLYCLIAGTTHRDKATLDRFIAGSKRGDELKLAREPNNPHDKLAVQVLAPNDDLLGFIPAGMNAAVARLLDAGMPMSCELDSCERSGNWRKIAVKVFGDYNAAKAEPEMPAMVDRNQG